MPKSRKFVISPFRPIRPKIVRKRIMATTREECGRRFGGRAEYSLWWTEDGDVITPPLIINLTN